MTNNQKHRLVVFLAGTAKSHTLMLVIYLYSWNRLKWVDILVTAIQCTRNILHTSIL